MDRSKCTLSLPVATPSAVVYCEHTTTRVSSDHNSHTFCCFCFCVWKRYLFCCLWWVGLSFLCCTLSFAVFWNAYDFNQDVSKWNTGAVTKMTYSECSLSPSPSLWPRLPLYMYNIVYILNIRQLEFHRITLLTRFFIFVSVFYETVLFCCCMWWVGLSFSMLHPLLQCFIKHLRSIRTCPNGIRGR